LRPSLNSGFVNPLQFEGQFARRNPERKMKIKVKTDGLVI